MRDDSIHGYSLDLIVAHEASDLGLCAFGMRQHPRAPEPLNIADGAVPLAQRYQKAVAAEEFQVWTLTVKADRTAALTCGDGNGKTVFEKPIPFTDFPAECITLWFENSTIYLPSEH